MCFCNNSDWGCWLVRLGWFYVFRKKYGWIMIVDIVLVNCFFDFVGCRNYRVFFNLMLYRLLGKFMWGSFLWDGMLCNYLRGFL